MDFARHHVEANRQVDGVALREHWEASARKGNADARARLDGPPLPEELEYLWLWALELHGRSGANMAGLNPLAYGTLADWSRLTEQYPDPLEVEALVRLDAVLMGAQTKPDEAPDDPVETPKWPERKVAHG